MAATTRWRDTQTSNFDEVLNKLEQDVPDDERTSSIYWTNFHSRKCFPENQQITLNNEDVTFNMIRFRYDQMTVQGTRAEDRPVSKSGFIIVYQYRTVINLNYS